MKLIHRMFRLLVVALPLGISLAAAVFAWQQVEVSRDHNRRSVIPILQATPYLEGRGGRNGIYLSNDGLGPAILKGFSVKSGGVVASGFDSDRWPEILAASALTPTCFATAWPKGEVALKPGSELVLLRSTSADNAEHCLLEVAKLISGSPIEITIDYESIYGETKQLRTNSNISSSMIKRLFSGVR